VVVQHSLVAPRRGRLALDQEVRLQGACPESAFLGWVLLEDNSAAANAKGWIETEHLVSASQLAFHDVLPHLTLCHRTYFGNSLEGDRANNDQYSIPTETQKLILLSQ